MKGLTSRQRAMAKGAAKDLSSVFSRGDAASKIAKGQATKDQATKAVAASKIAATWKGQASKGQATKDPAAKDPAAKDPAAKIAKGQGPAINASSTMMQVDNKLSAMEEASRASSSHLTAEVP